MASNTAQTIISIKIFLRLIKIGGPTFENSERRHFSAYTLPPERSYPPADSLADQQANQQADTLEFNKTNKATLSFSS